MNDEQSQRTLNGVNLTNFFNRPIEMYSFGDISFKQPIALKKVIYILVGFLVYTLPMFFILGFKLDPIYFIILLGPPILIGEIGTKPIFSGKTLPDFVKTLAKFAAEPKAWLDLRSSNSFGKDIHYVDEEIWVGRRRELQILADLEEKARIEAKKNKKTNKNKQ